MLAFIGICKCGNYVHTSHKDGSPTKVKGNKYVCEKCSKLVAWDNQGFITKEV